MLVTEVTKENYDREVLQADRPVLIDFWASWCGPCRALSPLVEEIAAETEQIKICKINVDEQPELAASFQVMSIPTLILLQNGVIQKQTVGLQPKQTIQRMIGL